MSKKSASKKATPAPIATRSSTQGEMVATGGNLPTASKATTTALARFKIEHRVTLEMGDMITGVFRGQGATVNFPDPDTGEVRPCKTWKLETSPNKIGVILGGANLDPQLENREQGKEIVVVRGAQKDTRKGRRVTIYLVGEPTEEE